MPISIVQSVGGNTNVPTIAASGSGNLIAVMIWLTLNGTVTSITDNAGNTYVQVPNAFATNGASHVSDIWYAKNSIAGATMLTINVTAGSVIVQVVECSGVDTVSPVDTAGHSNSIAATTTVLSPSLTITNGGDILFAVCPNDDTNSFNPTTVNSPWTILPNTLLGRAYDVYLLNPGSTGSYQATFNVNGAGTYCSSGVAFSPVHAPLSLMLSDSVSSSDVTIKEDEKPLFDSVTSSDALGVSRAQHVSDSMTVTDSSPNSFSVQSSAITPSPIPIVEQLVNKLVPAEVKTFFIVQ